MVESGDRRSDLLFMKSLVPIAAAPLLAMACASPAEQEARMSDEQIIPARDGNIAIREEYDAARKAATVAAWDLFIARHPDHPLADEARRERAKLIR